MVDQTTADPALASDFRHAPARSGRDRARMRAVRRLGDVLRPVVGLLTSPHSVASYLELIRPAQSLTETWGRVVGIEYPTSRAVTLTLRPDSTWSGHLPGQHVELGVDIGGVRYTRPFSLASSPDQPDGLLEITAACTGGPVTTHLRDRLRIGTLLTLSPAQGDFVLPQYAPNGLLFICGGSGITPVMSMIRTLHARGREEAVALLHYSRNQAEQLYRAETRELARRHACLQLMNVHTRESETTHTSHFAEHDLNEVRDYATRDVFVCGPVGLTREVTQYFRAQHPRSRVHSEYFTSIGPMGSRPRTHTVVEFARSGFSVRDSGDCLLHQAEEAGLSPRTAAAGSVPPMRAHLDQRDGP